MLNLGSLADKKRRKSTYIHTESESERPEKMNPITKPCDELPGTESSSPLPTQGGRNDGRMDGWRRGSTCVRRCRLPGSLAGHQTSDPFRFYPLRQLLPCNPSFWHRHPGRLTPHPSFVRDGLLHRASCPICLVMLVAGLGWLAGRCVLRCVWVC